MINNNILHSDSKMALAIMDEDTNCSPRDLNYNYRVCTWNLLSGSPGQQWAIEYLDQDEIGNAIKSVFSKCEIF